MSDSDSDWGSEYEPQSSSTRSRKRRSYSKSGPSPKKRKMNKDDIDTSIDPNIASQVMHSKPSRHKKYWTEKETQRLVKLANKKVSFDVMATKLGRTTNAIKRQWEAIVEAGSTMASLRLHGNPQ